MDLFTTTSMHAGVSPCFRRSSLRLASKASSSSRVISFRMAAGVPDARKWNKSIRFFKVTFLKKSKVSCNSGGWGVTLKKLLQFFLCVHVSLRHFPRHLQSCRILRRRRNSRASSSRSPHSKATLGAHWVGQLRSSMQEEWISPPKGSDMLLHSTEAFLRWGHRSIEQ